MVPLPITTNKDQRWMIKEIEYELQELILATDLSEIEFKDFGKNTIKKFGVSPDAFYQAAAHIATKRTLYVLGFPFSCFGSLLWFLFGLVC
jgi:hypothetical protein